MAKLKVKKGLEANLPAVEDGSLLITTDSKKLYLDNGEERIQVGGDSSSAGADSSIYTEDGIVKSDGVKFKSSSGSDAYLTLTDGNKNATITAKVPTTFTNTALAKVTLGAEINPASDFGIKTQKLVWDSAGYSGAYPALYPVLEHGTTATLGAQGKHPWTHAYISNLENTNTISWASDSSSTFSELKIGKYPGNPSIIIDKDRITLKSSNTTTGMSGQQESEILADNSLGATPSGSDFAASRLKLTVRQSGGPVGNGNSRDYSLVFGFTDAITCMFYTNYVVNLGSLNNPWGNLYLGAVGGGDIFKKGLDLSNTTSGSHDNTLVISNVFGNLPINTTSTANGTSYIKFDMNSWYQPKGTTRYSGDGEIIMSTSNNSSQVDVKLYPSVHGSTNLLTPSYRSYLGDSTNPWFYIYGRSINAGTIYNHPELNNITGTPHRVPVFWGVKSTSTLPTAGEGVREGDMCYVASSTGKVSLRIYSSNTWCTLSIT